MNSVKHENGQASFARQHFQSGHPRATNLCIRNLENHKSDGNKLYAILKALLVSIAVNKTEMAKRIVLAIFAIFVPTVFGQALQCQTSSTVNGNGNGARCVFPFIYLRNEYKECTTVNYGSKFWCATTGDYDADKTWGECICSVVNPNNPDPSPGEGCKENTRSGQECVGTFNYEGKSYSGCPTVDNSGTPWCSLTANYDADKQWANCAVPLQCETPQSGTGCRESTTFGTACAKSFIYNKVTYNGCTTVNNGGKMWCSLTPNFDTDNQFGACAVPLKCVTSGGAGPGCTEKTVYGGNCAPTFIYNTNKYDGCTTASNGGKPWCSLTENFDRDNQWAECQTPLQCSSEPEGDGCVEKTKSGGFCARKYIYNGNPYVGCTKVDYGNTPWCSMTDNYDRDKQFEACETPLKCTQPKTP